MTDLLQNLPNDIHNYIGDMLRPKKLSDEDPNSEEKIDPFAKASDVANMKILHRNFSNVPLWKNFEWTERIRKWCDKNLMTMRWKYQYGTLPQEMIKIGMENKINTEYRHQDCYVETMYGKGIGTGFIIELKMHKVIWFTVNLKNLISGMRPLPSIFGRAASNEMGDASLGTLNLSFGSNGVFVPAPSLMTIIPEDKRKEWLIECFKECILEYYGKKIAKKILKKRSRVESVKFEKSMIPNFIKEFKELMSLPSDYELTRTDLFRMFLKELKVPEKSCNCSGWTCFGCPDNIDLLSLS